MNHVSVRSAQSGAFRGFVPFAALAAISCAGALPVQALTAQSQPGPCEPGWMAANSMPGVEGSVFGSVGWDVDGPGPLPERVVLVGRYEGAASLPAIAPLLFDPATGTYEALGAPQAGPDQMLHAAAGPNGTLYTANDAVVQQWNGSGWTTIGATDSTAVLHTVRSLCVTSNGDLVVAGQFTSINGVAAESIARWNGSTWQPLGAGLPELAIEVVERANGDLLACGLFGVQRWDGSTWSAFAPGAPTPARACTELPNGDVVVSGEVPGFTLAVTVYSGGAWTTIATGVDVRSMTHTNAGELVVAGPYFTQIGGVPAQRVARWNGSSWSAMNVGFDAEVLRVTRLADGRIVATGGFRTADDRASAGFAIWDGATWQPAGDGINDDVLALHVRANGDVVLAGAFTGLGTVSGLPAQRIALRTPAGYQAIGEGFDRPVDRVAELPNGDLLAAGNFARSGAVPMTFLARFTQGAWQAFGDPNNKVRALCPMPNGDVVVGGSFTTIGGVSARQLARWDGASWSELGGGVAGGLIVEDVVRLPGGDLVVGGSLTNVGGVAVVNVARWDGAAWHAMGAGLPAVRDLLVGANGDVVAATVVGVYRWDGASWTQLGQVYAGALGTLGALVNGDLVLGGHAPIPLPGFPTNLQRWDGVAWTGLAERALGTIAALATTRDGALLVGGAFTRVGVGSAGEQLSPNLARLEPGCPATAASIRPGCVSSAGPVALSIDAAPWLGTTVSSTTTGIPATSIVVAAWGTASSNGAPLSNVLPSAFGCRLHVVSPFLQIAATTPGLARASLAIPRASALVGQQLFHQVLPIELDAGGAIAEASASNTFALTIGTF